ncbi:MAG: protein translocase subunit SecD [Planctomycetota bacterium]
MKQGLGVRFFVIAAVVGFLGYHAFQGVTRDKLQLGIDLEGGSELVFKFAFADAGDTPRRELLGQAMRIIQERVDAYGLKEIVIQPIGEDRFSVQVGARDRRNVDSIKELITVLGKLEFRITAENSTPTFDYYWKRFQNALKEGKNIEEARTITPDQRAEDDKGAGRHPLGLRWYRLSDRAIGQYSPGRLPEGNRNHPWVLCRLDDENISGEDLSSVNFSRVVSGGGTIGGGWSVHFRVNKFSQARMARLTATPQEFMAIILNDRVDSAPVLQSTLSDSGEITGSFMEEEAKSLAAVLQAGQLRERPELVSESTIAAELAGSARQKGVLSTIVSLGLVLVFILWYYYGPGLLANVALLLNLVLMIGVLAWFDAVLTLPGIAGVVLTVGMAVDANILIYERLKEERAKGRTLSQAVAAGYDRALVTIVDSNLTTLITAYFLFQMGSGPVRGFGVTLAVGIVVSMFTAIYVTRTFFVWLLRRGVIREAKMRAGFSTPRIGWMALRRPAGIVSILAVVGGIAGYAIVPDATKLDIEFTQGSKLVARFHRDLPLEEVRAKIQGMAADDPIYSDVAVRASAEGIGAAVRQGSARRFELRSQHIATRREIDAFTARLRETFADDLLPGPFKATLESAGPGKTRGTLALLDARVEPAFVREAFRQYHAATGRLSEQVEIEKLPSAPGAGAALRITLDVPPDQTGEIALNVRRALDAYDHAAAVRHAEETAKDENATPTEQRRAQEDLARFRAFESLPAGFFDEADPFPLADRIDPFTAREHRDAAVRAIVLSLFGIIVYVAFRFRSWAFGFASVVALVHDVAVTLGVTALVNWLGLVDARLNLVTVAAFLTLIGYSINDTIVIFDRIRENRGTGRVRLSEIIDRSVNQTLSRTIRTSLTVWIVVIVLFAFNAGGGSALEGFAFILTFGVIVGTYSTVFIASPTLIFLPWMWRRCGSSVRGLCRRLALVAPFIAGALIALDLIPAGASAGAAPSRVVFNDVLLSVPLALAALFLFDFWRWLRIEDPERELAAAA